jgi:signal transduction histidine kinase
VLAALGQHLEASADVDRLLTDVVDELESTLGLRQVSVTADDGTVLAGSASGGVDAVPLVAYGRPVGSLHFTTPTPLRPADRRLLDDLAGHLAGLLHARRLSGDLQRARERLVQAREEERRRLRRDLHDGLGPALAGHVLRADLAAHAFASGSPERASLEALRDDLRTTVAEVRRLVEGLRPPALDEMGLATALAQTIDRLTVGSGTACELELASLPPLSAAAEVAAYRIVTEAVTNVVRHGRAPHCRVAVDADERCLRLAVIDDGLGISSSAPRGHGLDTMRERAEELGGSFTVGRSPHGGTEVRAELPLASVPS